MAFDRFYSSKVRSINIWVALILYIYFTVDSVHSTSVASSMRDLKKELLKNYDKGVRPSTNVSDPTTVNTLFLVQHIVEMDEKKQSLTVKGFLQLLWFDHRLKWEPKDHENVKAVRFKKSELWIPDVVLLFSLGENEIGGDESIDAVVVGYTGMLKWYPAMVLTAPCSSKFRHYPFDEHNCSLQFGSWSHGDSIELRSLKTATSSQKIASASGWEVQNVSQELVVLNKFYNYTKVDVNIFLKRTSRIYKYACVVPTLLTVVMTLAAFWLQAAEPARYILGCSNFIMMSLLLQHLVTTVPAGKEIPIIAEYSASCLCMACIFIMVTISVNVISLKSSPPPVPLVRYAHNVLSRWLCLTTFSQPEFTKKQALATGPDSHPNRMAYFDQQISLAGDWLILSLVVDRIAFWVFVFIFVVLIGVLIGI